MRYHSHYHTAGAGHLYQGRFKSFPTQDEWHVVCATSRPSCSSRLQHEEVDGIDGMNRSAATMPEGLVRVADGHEFVAQERDFGAQLSHLGFQGRELVGRNA